MGKIVPGLQQLEIKRLHKEVLGREVNTSGSEAAPYLRRSEEIPSGPIPVVVLVKRRSLNSFSLEKGIKPEHSSGNYETPESLHG